MNPAESTPRPAATTPAAHPGGDPSPDRHPPSPKPPRAMPWWLLVVFLAIAMLSGWLGMRFGGRVAHTIRDIAATAGSSGSTTAAGHDQSEHQGADSGSATQYYTCGMHPWVILPRPGDCPICHMKLTPLDPAKFTGQVAIDPMIVQNIGVRIGAVTRGPLTRSIRTVGNVDYDETRVRDVNTKISGWIEKLHVDYVGATVKEGQPLFELYSPALFQAQEEYLLALRTQRPAAGAEPRQDQPFDMVQSARMKLELFDVSPAQIDALARDGRPSRTMTIASPHTGIVIAKHANEGMMIDSGMQVFRIADLTRVWVLVTLYESQLPFVSEGQAAAMTLPYIPGQRFEGRVVYIYTYVDTRTREVQVRLEFDNSAGILKPGMFATVELQSTLRQEAVLAPRDAVISTGARNVAFVSLGEGKFEPRPIRLGVETSDGNVEILEGLKPGELVVTSGQFLLDSESRVREALAKMIRGDLASDQAAQVSTAGRSELSSLPDIVAASLADAIEAYFSIGDQLASDKAQGIAGAARSLAAALDRAINITIPEDEHFWHKHTEAAVARGAALQLVSIADLPSARAGFADLSVAMDSLIRATGVPPAMKQEVQALHCPMFREGQGGALWLQPAGSVRNPFFGSTMLECFDRREALPVTGQTPPSNQPGAEPAAPVSKPGVEASAEARLALDSVIAEYLAAQQQLTQDNGSLAAAALTRLKSSLPPLLMHQGEVGEAARRIDSSIGPVDTNLESLRTRFTTISNAMLTIVAAMPPPIRENGLYHAYCPMVKENWLQTGEAIRNPYDPEMLECGTIKGRLDHGGSR